jgi:hypothetical protein
VPTIKNVGAHVDDLHDGRPIERMSVATVSASDLERRHYQARIADGRFLVLSDQPKRRRRTQPESQEDDQ